MLRWVLILSGLVWAQIGFANRVAVKKEKLSSNTAEELKGILLDFENFCEEGCAYHINGVIETKILTSDENKILLWQSLKGYQPINHYVQVSIEEREDQQVKSIITLRYPLPEDISTLESKYQKKHHSIFNDFLTRWSFREIKDQNQNFIHTEVIYFSEVSSPIIASAFGEYLIRFQLNQKADEMLSLIP
jgi:hypothetical protein